MARITDLGSIGSTKIKATTKTKSKKRKSLKDKLEKETKKSKIKKEKPERITESKSKKEKPKRKKKKSSKELMKKAEKASGQISALEAQLVEAQNDPTIRESEQFQEYFEMFNSLKVIARVIEKRCKESAQSKDIYALMQLYNQMREVIADIRTLRDIAGVAELLRDEVIDPLMQSSANELVQLNQALRQFILKTIEGDSALAIVNKLNDLSANAGDALHEAYGNAIDKTVETLEQQ
jgi:hypothetical protein